MFKTLRSRIALLLIAANLPVIVLAVWIGVRDFRAADLVDRDRLVQAANLVAARTKGYETQGLLDEVARRAVFQDGDSRAMIAAAILNGRGEVVAADSPKAFGEAWLPPDGLPREALASDLRIRKARGADGRPYRYAMATVPGGDATAIAAAPFDFMGRRQTQWLLLALGLPALMSLLCIGFVLFGIERFVLKWLRALRVTAEASRGDRMDVRAVNFDKAPLEIARLGEALDAMSGRIEERSQALTAALGERDRLLRELHHRVKNNFQMIASLLALQRQEAPQSLSAVLRAPEDRVRAMAAAYKSSYASGEIGHVEVAELIRDVALQARDAAGGRRFEAKILTPGPVGEVDLDKAVPLALLVMELLSAAAAAGGDATLSIVQRPDRRLALIIESQNVNWLPTTGLPLRLIRAYTEQIGGAVGDWDQGRVEFEVALASEEPKIGMAPSSGPKR